MKTYNSPMLQVVGIKKSDIIATSNPGIKSAAFSGDVEDILAPGRGRDFNSWYEGY